MADLVSFESEFMSKLKHDRMMLVSEIVTLGKKHGLNEPQVQRIIEGIGYELGKPQLQFFLS